MSVICLTGRMPEDWQERVLAEAPRLALERLPEGDEASGPLRIWVDGRGMAAEDLARRLVRSLGTAAPAGVAPPAPKRSSQVPESRVRVGVAAVPVSAWAAAFGADEGDVAIVRAGADRAFLAGLPLQVLEMEDRVRMLLEGTGVETCGDLAALPREAVEVRFGPAVIVAWRRARAEDERRLFRRPPPSPPHALMDFVDYVVTDPERLVFTANALLGPLCETMSTRGSHARQLTITLPLANGEIWQRTLKAARPTASRSTWLRLLRGVLERLTVPDAVSGIELRIESTEAAHAIQGDLFDAGFGTVAGVETALTRVLENQGEVMVRPEPSAHPLPELRTCFVAETEVLEVAAGPVGTKARRTRRTDAGDAEASAMDPAGLTLQLLPEPRSIQVETVERRDHSIPLRYRDDRWRVLVTAAGPERVSGGQWEAVYAREYYRCVTGDGQLVWIYRDGVRGSWWLQGWWD